MIKYPTLKFTHFEGLDNLWRQLFLLVPLSALMARVTSGSIHGGLLRLVPCVMVCVCDNWNCCPGTVIQLTVDKRHQKISFDHIWLSLSVRAMARTRKNVSIFTVRFLYSVKLTEHWASPFSQQGVLTWGSASCVFMFADKMCLWVRNVKFVGKKA